MLFGGICASTCVFGPGKSFSHSEAITATHETVRQWCLAHLGRRMPPNCVTAVPVVATINGTWTQVILMIRGKSTCMVVLQGPGGNKGSVECPSSIQFGQRLQRAWRPVKTCSFHISFKHTPFLHLPFLIVFMALNSSARVRHAVPNEKSPSLASPLLDKTVVSGSDQIVEVFDVSPFTACGKVPVCFELVGMLWGGGFCPR